MKNILITLIASVLILFGITLISAETSSYKFKHTMHHVLDNYTHARISYSLKKYDISDIFLKHVLENLKEVPAFIPDYNMDGMKLDKEVINKRLNELKQKMSSLRDAVRKRELKEINNPLIEFVSKWQNGNPDKNAIDILLPVLVKDFELLKNIKDADEPILDSVWSKVAESTKIILNSLSILTDNQYSSLKDMILHCSHEKSPKKYPNDEKEYNFPSWSPAPRTEAAIILP